MTITQALHHGTERRANICTNLGALVRELPRLTAWDYIPAGGRMALKTSTSGE
jgi:hypothetical protein